MSAFDGSSGWRRHAAGFLNAVAVGLVAPFGLAATLEHRVKPSAEIAYLLFAQMFAGVPGYPGVVLRRAYYWWTLEQSSLRLWVGYGAYFSHRTNRLDDHVYIGPYAVIGSSDIGKWALIGTRASLLSGGNLHTLDADGRWLPADYSRMARIRVGAHAWIGEGAIVMADVGDGAMIAAGAVVSSPVAGHVMVAGNPARFVRSLEPVAAVRS